MSEIHLRLSWQAAWADRENDFLAHAPNFDGTVGRIFQTEMSTGIVWEWFFHAHGPDICTPVGNMRGSEPTPRLAAKRVEDAWHAATKGTARDFMPAAVNAYAAAKYGM